MDRSNKDNPLPRTQQLEFSTEYLSDDFPKLIFTSTGNKKHIWYLEQIIKILKRKSFDINLSFREIYENLQEKGKSQELIEKFGLQKHHQVHLLKIMRKYKQIYEEVLQRLQFGSFIKSIEKNIGANESSISLNEAHKDSIRFINESKSNGQNFSHLDQNFSGFKQGLNLSQQQQTSSEQNKFTGFLPALQQQIIEKQKVLSTKNNDEIIQEKILSQISRTDQDGFETVCNVSKIIEITQQRIRQLLQDKNSNVRKSAVGVIEQLCNRQKIKKEETYGYIFSLLQDVNQQVRYRACDFLRCHSYLREVNPKSSLDQLMPLLEDKYYLVRKTTVEMISQFDQQFLSFETAIKIIKPLLKDEHQDVRSSAIFALDNLVSTRRINNVQIIFDLIKPLLKDDKQIVLNNVSWALCTIADYAQINTMTFLDMGIQLLNNQNQSLRDAAMSLIYKAAKKGQISFLDAVYLIIPKLKDQLSIIRQCATYKLSSILKGPKINSETALKLVKELLNDENQLVRRCAKIISIDIILKEQIDFRTAIQLLQPLMKDQQSQIKNRATNALGYLRDKSKVDIEKVLDIVKLHLKGQDQKIFYKALNTLYLYTQRFEINVQTILDHIKPFLNEKYHKSQDESCKRVAVNVLSLISIKPQINAQNIIGIVHHIVLKSKKGYAPGLVSQIFKKVLARPEVDSEAGLNLMKPLLKDKDQYTRHRTIQALGYSQAIIKTELEMIKLLLFQEQQARSARSSFITQQENQYKQGLRRSIVKILSKPELNIQTVIDLLKFVLKCQKKYDSYGRIGLDVPNIPYTIVNALARFKLDAKTTRHYLQPLLQDEDDNLQRIAEQALAIMIIEENNSSTNWFY